MLSNQLFVELINHNGKHISIGVIYRTPSPSSLIWIMLWHVYQSLVQNPLFVNKDSFLMRDLNIDLMLLMQRIKSTSMQMFITCFSCWCLFCNPHLNYSYSTRLNVNLFTNIQLSSNVPPQTIGQIWIYRRSKWSSLSSKYPDIIKEHTIVIMLTFYIFVPNLVDKSLITKEQPLANQRKLLLHIWKNHGTEYYGNVIWKICYLFSDVICFIWDLSLFIYVSKNRVTIIFLFLLSITPNKLNVNNYW